MSPLLLASILIGCPGPDTPTPMEAAAISAPEERQCLLTHCATLQEAQAFEACRAERCAPREPVWALDPQRVNYRDETIFVQTAVSYQPGGFGDVEQVRAEMIYVGVTVVTSAGEEIDLAVQTRFPEDIAEPFFLSAEVGPDAESVIMGLWDRKIEPCDSQRDGCQKFGFLLDGWLATWPTKVYVDKRRQRIPPQQVQLQVRNAGLPPVVAEQVSQAAAESLRATLAVFEAEVLVAPVQLAATPSTRSLVVYRHPGDAVVATDVAGAIMGKLRDQKQVGVAERSDSGADITIVAGGPNADLDHACLLQHCAPAEDAPAEDAQACFVENCT